MQFVIGSALFPLIGSALFPLLRKMHGVDSKKGWRKVCVIPAIVAWNLFTASLGDAHKGKYSEMKKHGNMLEVSTAAASFFQSQAVNLKTLDLVHSVRLVLWFGIDNGKIRHTIFREESSQSTESAAAIASILAG